MIFDATYINKETKERLEEEVGRPYGFITRFKIAGGIGSHRMILEKSSAGFSEILERATGTVYGSIEMRPKGVLIHLNVKNTQYSWSIPFYKLVLYSTDYFSIHSEGEFISFRKDHFLNRNTTFINRMMDQRIQYLGEFEGPNV